MTPVLGRFDAVVCDLDGVVYRGPSPVRHAVEALSALEVPVLYATNNASRAAGDVAAHLQDLGVPCAAEDVLTSSDAAAWLLSEDTESGPVLCIGGSGVARAVADAGFEPVTAAQARDVAPVAVVQGYGPDVSASDLAEAAYAVQAGARWVATNTDGTLPTDRGTAPGNGTLVAAVARAVGRPPDLVAGKPGPALYLLGARRLGVAAERVLAVGDRLETDVEGAVAAGMESLLVLTGVDDLEAALEAPAERRPTVVAPDLRWLGPMEPSTQDLRSAFEQAPSDGGAAVRRLLSEAGPR
ncbi:HAD-IIA family hydrolase [Phycicoccus sp. BSK3Z-2]|uniref:HAD-IIA family hydrolase n=1 Tax=Phycicoccus avicenniae TaxID=2828860 RepID=A0A941HYP9_9MICO|nr:HAD-IIA family hydrolase [Phycicoccus avicenniae]MBR7742085.1 HAD-IIA family hydrolase [Phycicoccus avicenniae]